jgi:hypothetical protein
MQSWQKIFLLVYSLINLVVFVKGFYECKYKKNAYGLTPYLILLGIIAWGDAVVFCLFWIGASLVSFMLNDWYLFLLIVAVFWVIRSLGETIYWFNQQFSGVNRNPPKKFTYIQFFKTIRFGMYFRSFGSA